MSFATILSQKAKMIGSKKSNQSEFYDLVMKIYQNFGAAFDTRESFRNVLGSRKETALTEGNLHGLYDDSIWVVWIGKNEIKHATEYKASTEPNYRYVKRGIDGKDANKDKKLDIGRLPLGIYTYKSVMEHSKRLKADVFKMKQAYRIERDINRDGNFNEEDIK